MAIRCPNCRTENSDGRRYCGECGAMLSPPSPPDENRGRKKGQPYRLRVNLLCLTGAIIAVVSLFLPWAMVQDGFGDEETVGGFDFDDPVAGGNDLPDAFRYSLTIFIIGTLFSFFTPLGGIPLVIGAVGFAATSLTSQPPGYELIPWIGVVVAMVSAGVVILSFIEPTGTGYSKDDESGLTGRLLTLSAYRDAAEEVDQDSESQ